MLILLLSKRTAESFHLHDRIGVSDILEASFCIHSHLMVDTKRMKGYPCPSLG